MIPIFKYEQEAGLANIIRSHGSVVLTAKANAVSVDSAQKEQIKQLLESSATANPNQFDLFYLESVLVSVGWNQNDDVFDKEETWIARTTPVDKQFNFMHNERDIIGHLTSSKVVDFNKNIVASDIDLKDLPDQFDIVVGSVLYKHWSDSQLQERMEKIIAEILEDKWFVSMECLFRNFDYAVVTPDGQNKVIARNDQTSFLTKHLRIYGGTGEYDGNKLGRLLRNFTFSGKGLVDNPANPRSHITNTDYSNEVSSFVGTSASMDELNIKEENNLMSGITQEQYDALKLELEQLKASKEQETQKEIDDLKARIVELEKSNADLASELEVNKEVVKAKDETIEGLNKELSDVKTKLDETQAVIKQKELEAVTASRKTLLLEKVDEERANVLIEKFVNASDEMFNLLVESLPAKKMEKEEEEEEEDDSKATQTDLENVTLEDNEISDGGDVNTNLVTKASSWFVQNVLRSTAKQEGDE